MIEGLLFPVSILWSVIALMLTFLPDCSRVNPLFFRLNPNLCSYFFHEFSILAIQIKQKFSKKGLDWLEYRASFLIFSKTGCVFYFFSGLFCFRIYQVLKSNLNKSDSNVLKNIIPWKPCQGIFFVKNDICLKQLILKIRDEERPKSQELFFSEILLSSMIYHASWVRNIPFHRKADTCFYISIDRFLRSPFLILSMCKMEKRAAMMRMLVEIASL